MADDREDAIRARAYRLWEQSDRAHGQHDKHWRQAQDEIQGASHEAGDKTVSNNVGDRSSEADAAARVSGTPKPRR